MPWSSHRWEALRSARYPAAVLAADSSAPFLGNDLLPYLVLAIGGAMVVGNLAAVLRPPARAQKDGDLDRAPVARSMVMVVIGFVAALWALVSLLV